MGKKERKKWIGDLQNMGRSFIRCLNGVRVIAGTQKIAFEWRGAMLVGALGLQQMGCVTVVAWYVQRHEGDRQNSKNRV